MSDETEVGIAPDAQTEAALAWSTEELDQPAEGQEPRWPGRLRWGALAVLLAATAVAVLWLSTELLHTLARPVTGVAAPGPPVVSSAPAIAPVVPALNDDERLIASLNAQGMTDPNPTEVIANAHGICYALAHGGTVAGVRKDFMAASPGLTDRTAAAFVATAMSTYPNCSPRGEVNG